MRRGAVPDDAMHRQRPSPVVGESSPRDRVLGAGAGKQTSSVRAEQAPVSRCPPSCLGCRGGKRRAGKPCPVRPPCKACEATGGNGPSRPVEAVNSRFPWSSPTATIHHRWSGEGKAPRRSSVGIADRRSDATPQSPVSLSRGRRGGPPNGWVSVRSRRGMDAGRRAHRRPAVHSRSSGGSPSNHVGGLGRGGTNPQSSAKFRRDTPGMHGYLGVGVWGCVK